MRERFSFESTQFLIGSHALGPAVTKVIQLVCEHLGWEWGAYWAVEADKSGTEKLACKHYWHVQDSALTSFTDETLELRVAPGEGLVGHVWNTGSAGWVEDMSTLLAASQIHCQPCDGPEAFGFTFVEAMMAARPW